MPFFKNEDINIYYEIEGKGPPVVLIHGFSANLDILWRTKNWVNYLKENYRLILLDCRGHGKSDKPHSDSDYGKKMAEDILNLLKHLSIEKANLFGYSMGANITFWLLLTNPEIFISAILGGFVLNFPKDEKEKSKRIKNAKQIIEAFKAESIDEIKNPMARTFRKMAELNNNDLLALAAVQAGALEYGASVLELSPVQIRNKFKNLKVPVMTVVGSNEIISGDKTLVAQLVPGACHFQIQGKNHLTVTSDPKFHMVVKAFLDHVN